jgi:hypothetical protein
VISCTAKQVVGGIDMHKNSHVAVIIDVTERFLDTKSFPTMTASYESLGDELIQREARGLTRSL